MCIDVFWVLLGWGFLFGVLFGVGFFFSVCLTDNVLFSKLFCLYFLEHPGSCSENISGRLLSEYGVLTSPIHSSEFWVDFRFKNLSQLFNL